MAERSTEQTKLALTDYGQTAQEAVSAFDQWIEASQVGTQGISKKAMKFAQRNVLSAFEFAQKIVQARDVNELIRMQTEFVQWARFRFWASRSRTWARPPQTRLRPPPSRGSDRADCRILTRPGGASGRWPLKISAA